MRTHEFAKGHGTENDFVILPDPDGELALDRAQVARITDRRSGIGGDGILRVVRSKHVPEADPYTQWFMDYRNADGSLAQMCGNGVRVFARYLQVMGWASTDFVDVSTRAGTKRASFNQDGSITVDMGSAQILGSSATSVGGHDLRGLGISMGNPHLAVELTDSTLRLDELDLSTEPQYDAGFFPVGVNQEFYVVAAGVPQADVHVRMRVHERGVGETRSCGTGVCAVAVAALSRIDASEGKVVVDVPGGRLWTEVADDRVLLRGPAVIVAYGRWSE